MLFCSAKLAGKKSELRLWTRLNALPTAMPVARKREI